MRLVKEYLSDNDRPSDEEIRECIKIVETEDCIIKLKWYVRYDGWYRLYVNKGMTFDDCKNKLPRFYGM